MFPVHGKNPVTFSIKMEIKASKVLCIACFALCDIGRYDNLYVERKNDANEVMSDFLRFCAIDEVAARSIS